MAGRLINAQEAARADIARDLHDDVSQKLAYVSMGVNSLKRADGNIQDPETQQAIATLERETRNTFDGIRRLSHELHPATLRLLGLAPALRSHCEEVAKRQGIEVQFSERRQRRHGASRCGGVLLSHRAGIHAQQHRAWRRKTPDGGVDSLRRSARARLWPTMARGFDVSAVRSNGGGLGLVTMEERANLVGGDVSVDSEVGRGTTVHVHGPATTPGRAILDGAR